MTEDEALARRVADELDYDTRLNAAHIRVAARDGAVTLSGFALSLPEKHAALEGARRVSGVRAVADDLGVELPPEREDDDAAVAERIAHVLHWGVAGAEQGVKAQVMGGFVTLTGEVDWHHERRHVEEQVRHVRGVRGLCNSVLLRHHPKPADLERRIEAALGRQAELGAHEITVSVDGDRVVLEGRVRGLAERDAAERAVWAAPGVRELDDRLEVR
jgi:osmotically-inducible protein OsmY